MSDTITGAVLMLIVFIFTWLIDRAFKLNTPTWLWGMISVVIWLVLSILWQIYGPR